MRDGESGRLGGAGGSWTHEIGNRRADQIGEPLDDIDPDDAFAAKTEARDAIGIRRKRAFGGKRGAARRRVSQQPIGAGLSLAAGAIGSTFAGSLRRRVAS